MNTFFKLQLTFYVFIWKSRIFSTSVITLNYKVMVVKIKSKKKRFIVTFLKIQNIEKDHTYIYLPN